ncbi:MAG: hypothetical protein MJ158_00935 [Alphaproteobacteria bacterium]|nr:hypothetical protein [Alphaproteobacteria bacterium]
MKPFYLLLLALCVSACNKVDAPKCWDKNIKQELLALTWTETNNDVNSPLFGNKTTFKAKQINEIIEVPALNKKNSRHCETKILYEDGKIHAAQYEAIYIISETGKKAAFTDVRD